MKKSLLSLDDLTVAGTTVPLVHGGQGRPLLFLNGGDAFHRSQPWLNLLAGSYDLYAPRHPGYGGAPAADHIRSVNELSLFYLELLDQCDLTDTILVGASFGAWVALEMAVRSCARLSCIVLIDSLGVKFGGPTDAEIADIYTLPPDKVKSLQYADTETHGPNYAAMDEEAARIVIEDRTGEALYGWRPYMHNPVLHKWLWRIRRPTLVLWGAQDGIVSTDYGRRIAMEIPGAEFRSIPGCGHYPHVENPQAVMDCLVSFASRVGAHG